MPDIDLSQLNKGGGRRVQNTNTEVIDTTAGKVRRSGNYVPAAQARATAPAGSQAKKEYDPIFDTPPTYKVQPSEGNIQSLGGDDHFGQNETFKARTPVTSGAPPKTPSQEPAVHSVGEPKKEEVPDPTPLKVVNNFARPLNAEEGQLSEFDVDSLPKKKQEIAVDEQDAMNDLAAAVDRECESITQRIHDITQKQYEELVDAQQSGQHIARPMTDEEVEAAERAAVESATNTVEEEETIMTDPPQQVKRIVVADGVNADDSATIKVDKSRKEEELAEICINAIQYVDNHVTTKDYFQRVLHCKNYLSKSGIFAELWAIVMFNHEDESVAHPFLFVERDDIRVIIEVNIDSIKGAHILDPNDTVESIYKNFQHKGMLYEYIDYLAKMAVVKLPADMPTLENALKLAKEQLGETTMQSEEIKNTPVEEEPARPEPKDELESAIVREEADTLYGEQPEPEIPEETVTGFDPVADNVRVEAPVVEETTTTAISEEPVVVNKSYDGAVAVDRNPGFTSEDIQKDLEKELDTNLGTTPSDEQILNELRTAVRQNIPSIKNRINLRDFKISDTPMSAAAVAGFSIKDINQADWILPNAKRVVTVRGLSGPELFAMDPRNSNKNKINTFRQIYGIIYKHIVSKKPSTFDEWLKVTRFSDIDHIYAALHRATFSGSNFVHFDCPECNHIFVKDFTFDEMVHYDNDEAKAKAEKLLNQNNTSIPDYEVQLNQISDDYAVGLKDPSIWSMVMETAALSDEFLSKYEDLMDTMSFIDSVYKIDRENQSLIPIDFAYDAKDPAKSTARKITILSEIIRNLSSDSYFELRTKIAQLFSSNSDISYQIPAAVCPKCGHKFDAETSSAMQILFMRHQLGALGVI